MDVYVGKSSPLKVILNNVVYTVMTSELPVSLNKFLIDKNNKFVLDANYNYVVTQDKAEEA